MKKYMEDTLKYYEDNSLIYSNTWQDLDFEIPNIFLSYLKDDSYILDLGCGIGRDSKIFIDKGYKVKAIDGSLEMCKIAREVAGVETEQINFLDIDYHDEFDGVFACASLLHLDNEDLIMVLKKVKESLKDKGILYACFKYGTYERYEERYFNDMTEDKFKDIMKQVEGFKFIKSWISEQYRIHKIFINFILRKEGNYE